MKFTKILPVAMLSLLLATGCTVGSGIISVNDEPITKAEYNKLFEREAKSPQYTMFGGDALKDPDSIMSLILRNKIVNELIVSKLIDQEVKKAEIKITNEDIKAKKEEIAAEIGGMDVLKERLKEAGVKESELDNNIKEEIKINKLIEKTSPVSVSDADAKKFYDSNKSQFKHNDRVRASHILIMVEPDKIKQEIIDKDKKGELNAEQIDAKVQEKIAELKAKAEEIRQKAVNAPQDFAKLAKEFSQDPGSQKQGGDLGFFEKGQMVPEFEKVAFTIAPNKVSELVETPYGYHIIIVTDRAKAGVDSFDKVKPEIIAYLTQKKKIEALQKLLEGLRANAKIEYNDENYKPEVIQQKVQEALSKQQEQAKEQEKEAK